MNAKILSLLKQCRNILAYQVLHDSGTHFELVVEIDKELSALQVDKEKKTMHTIRVNYNENH